MSSKKKKVEEKQIDTKQDKVQAKYSFTGDELVELGRVADRNQTESESLEQQLSSIKNDYKSRIEAAEMRRNNAFSKLRDGFEMREYDAMIVFNRPKKGLKSLYHLDVDAKDKIGEFIRDETMTPGDCQAELFAQQRAEEVKEAGKAEEIPNPVLPE